MESIRDLEELLLPAEDQPPQSERPNCLRIVVLKQFRFHKSLCIELYDAPLTQAGKIRNPLSPVTATDAALEPGNNVEAVRFYAAIGRFQSAPASGKTATDIRTLRTVIKNPLSLRFFCHDPGFSENVSAGSLNEVQVGDVLEDFVLQVHKADPFYRIIPQLQLDNKLFHPRELSTRFDFFVLHEDRLWLAHNITIVRLLQVFATRPHLQVHESRFREFQDKVLSRLEEKVLVQHHYIEPAQPEQLQQAGWLGARERLIYLSDLGQYVMINPMMRYGNMEVPVRSKKMVHLPDARGRLMALHRDEAAENEFLALLLKQHPHFLEQLDEGLTYLYLHRDRFLDEDWFLSAFEQWREAGISVFGFNQLKDNKKNPNKGQISVQVETGLNWFNVHVKVRFGEQQASLQQLQQAVRNKNRFVQLDDGTLGLLPEAWIERMSKFFHGASVMGEDLVMAGTQFETVREWFTDDELTPQVQDKIRNYRESLTDITTLAPVAVPRGLHAQLRRYQQEGLNWLWFLHQQQFGGVLADDMGLGKTVQVIAFLLLLKERGYTDTHLLVVPTSLLFNWQAELNRFAPSLRHITLHGAGREKNPQAFAEQDLVITSYGTLLSDISFLRRYPFGYVFLDESQLVKNPGSQRYQAVQMLRSHNRLAITGTPIENNTVDLYAQFSFACPGLLGSRKYFQDIYSTPIDKFEDRRRAEELQRKVAPFLLRRTKEEVIQELPDKTEQVLYCPMAPAQRAVYEAHEKELRDYLEGKMEDEILRNSIHVLRGLTQLRQICDDPRLLQASHLQGEGSSKIETLLEQVEAKAPRHKILVFSQFVSMLELIAAELTKSGIGFETLTGATRNREAVVQRFQQDPEVRVFLLSLKAGGVGLNLTAATYVYLVDPWWNPAVEDQAIDRAYRIGQHQNVQAIRLVCPNTVEEKMMQLQQRKKELSAGLVQSGNAFFSSMTKEDWKAVLGG